MLFSAVGMLFANHQYNSRGVVWGRPLAGLLGIVTVSLTTAKIIMILSLPIESRGLIIKKDQDYLNSAVEFLGDYIATNYPGSKIVTITEPITERNHKQHEATMTFLQKGLAGKAETLNIESVLIKSKNDNDQDPHFSVEDVEFNALAFDLMTARHPKSDLIISFLNLPQDYYDMKFWTIPSEKRPKLIMVLGDPYELKNAIEFGYISAMITTNPKYSPASQQEIPKDYRELFHQRFVVDK